MGLPGETVTAKTNRVKKQGEDLEKIKVNGLGWLKLGQGINSWKWANICESGFSTEGTSISASTVHHCRR